MNTPLLIDFSPSGDIIPPPSKSYGHRALICGALAAAAIGRESVISNAGPSEDIEVTRRALPLFGAEASLSDDRMIVRPVNPDSRRIIDCGESGSTLRFLLPLAAATLEGPIRFTGRGRLLARPLTAYADVFAQSGVRFGHKENEVIIEGRLRGGDYRLPGNVSSQFVSGLLLALPLAEGDSTIELTTHLESAPYVDMTLEVMKDFGVKAKRMSDSVFSVPGSQNYRPADYQLEADYSQAAFFLAAAALGRPVRCLGLRPDSLQGDRAIVSYLERMGAEVTWSGDAVTVNCGGQLNAITVDVRETPDLVPVLAALMSLAKGESRIVNAGRLRLKESDRLHSMATELAALGAKVAEEADSLVINGRASLPGGVAVEAHNDHRVAMALAVASLGCERPITIIVADCVNKSYPAFWRDFGKAV